MNQEQFSGYLDRWIEQHREQIVQSLMEVLAINSMELPPEAGKPFGPEVGRAIDWFVDRAQSYGMSTRNVEGYAAHAEIGQGNEMAMALTHVDIVPTGTGWSKNALGEISQGVIYGRGTQDDKGPTVACLFALKAIADSKAAVNRRIRLVVGGNEESGFRCVRRYFQVEELPTYGFSPDAAFPLVFAEKGTMNIQAEINLLDQDAAADGCRLLRLDGGERANIVAQRAEAVLEVPKGQEEKVEALLREHVEKAVKLTGGPGPLEFTFSKEPGALSVTVRGKAAHAASPHEGTNALVGLLLVLAGLREKLALSEALSFLGNAGEIYGKGLDIDSEDEVSGRLSCNLGTAVTDEGSSIRFTYNIRYPVKVSGDGLKSKAESMARPNSVKLQVVGVGMPHYTDPESFLVKTLLGIYREETGDTSPPVAIGGGTYARVIPGGVAFGPAKPGSLELAHQADERISIDDLLQLVRIYARSLFALAI